MKIELASDALKNKGAEGKYIYNLLSRGALTRYEVDGKLAYDQEEFENRNKRVGRPLKGTTIKIL